MLDVKLPFLIMMKSVTMMADKGITKEPRREINDSASSTNAGKALNAIAAHPNKNGALYSSETWKRVEEAISSRVGIANVNHNH